MRFVRILFLVFCFLVIVLLIWLSSGSGMDRIVTSLYSDDAMRRSKIPAQPEVVICVVTCGMRSDETLIMLKSALVFNKERHPMRFVVVTEVKLMEHFRQKLDDWREALQNSFRYELVPLTFPEPNQEEWKTLFKPCAAQRLFLPTLLSHIDSVLYLDTDTLFLSSASDIWKLFQTFNESQIVGLSPEHEDKNVGWYNRFARHPFYGELGVNSGVMLMNLTRMRQFGWEEKIFPIYKEYKLKIIWGDQDLINILFHFHPEKLLVFPCEWNYRPDHCMYMSVCNTSGIRIIHGNRGYFHSDKQPIFKYLYNAISEYQLNDEPYRHFLLPLEISLKDIAVVSSNCGKVTDKFLYKAKQIFKENLYDYNSE